MCSRFVKSMFSDNKETAVQSKSMRSSDQKLKLTYFDFKGKGEATRLALFISGVEFEDNRISMEAWFQMKNDTMFGNVPLLQDGDLELAQSTAILRYVALKYNPSLYPTD